MTISKLISYFFLILILMFVGSILKSGQKGIEAEKRLTDIQVKVDNLEKQNQVLSGGADKYLSLEFIEKQIRNKLKLVKPGEKVVILPTEVSEKSEDTQYSYKEIEEVVAEDVENWRSWFNLFL